MIACVGESLIDRIGDKCLIGGCPLNVAIAASRLGAPVTDFVAGKAYVTSDYDIFARKKGGEEVSHLVCRFLVEIPVVDTADVIGFEYTHYQSPYIIVSLLLSLMRFSTALSMSWKYSLRPSLSVNSVALSERIPVTGLSFLSFEKSL